MYSMEGRVRYSEADVTRHMTLTALLNYFQDCCTFQSEELGVGLDFLEGEQAVWLLVSWQVIIKRLPVFGEKIRISTWPYDFGGCYGFRNFTMEDGQGAVLAHANSIWAFVDTATGRPRKIAPSLFQIYKKEPRYEMEYSGRKIAVPAETVEKEAFSVHSSLIDTNRHVNNEKYIEIAQEYLPAHFAVREMRAEYRKSAVLGDVICPCVSRQTDRVVVVLADEQKKPYAIVEFKEEI